MYFKQQLRTLFADSGKSIAYILLFCIVVLHSVTCPDFCPYRRHCRNDFEYTRSGASNPKQMEVISEPVHSEFFENKNYPTDMFFFFLTYEFLYSKSM